MSLGKERVLPIFAIVILLIGISSAIYVNASISSTDLIKIKNQYYSINEIFTLVEKTIINIDDGKKIGVSLENLIIKLDIGCPSCFKYTIKGRDGYQQTVDWEILKTGILTDYYKIYFPNTAHKFWVKDVIEIEVK
jgi:hypothetical protein